MYSTEVDASENHGRSETLYFLGSEEEIIVLLEGSQALLSHYCNKNSIKLKTLCCPEIAVCNEGSGILIFFKLMSNCIIWKHNVMVSTANG
jgi:hypothetical protein